MHVYRRHHILGMCAADMPSPNMLFMMWIIKLSRSPISRVILVACISSSRGHCSYRDDGVAGICNRCQLTGADLPFQAQIQQKWSDMHCWFLRASRCRARRHRDLAATHCLSEG